MQLDAHKSAVARSKSTGPPHDAELRTMARLFADVKPTNEVIELLGQHQIMSASLGQRARPPRSRTENL
jgi:hypothetical protein